MKTLIANLTAKARDGGNPGHATRWFSMRGDVLRYVLAPLAVAVALVVRMALTPILHDSSPYLFFVPAVLLAAGLGGWGPGLTATALGAPIGLFIDTGFSGISVPEVVNVVAFILVGAGVAWGGEQLQRNRIQAAASARQALAREAHLT